MLVLYVCHIVLRVTSCAWKAALRLPSSCALTYEEHDQYLKVSMVEAYPTQEMRMQGIHCALQASQLRGRDSARLTDS